MYGAAAKATWWDLRDVLLEDLYRFNVASARLDVVMVPLNTVSDWALYSAGLRSTGQDRTVLLWHHVTAVLYVNSTEEVLCLADCRPHGAAVYL